MAQETEAEMFGRGVCKLLQEYAQKLEQRMSEMRAAKQAAQMRKINFVGSTEWQSLQQRIGSLSQALLTATREASQLAEQGDVRDLTRFELRLRRAEVEGLIHASEFLLNSND